VRRALPFAAVLFALLAAGYAAAARLGPLPAPVGWPPPSDLTEYAAVLHVHSRYSHDGRGTVEEIAAAAARLGIRVVLLTDHNTLRPLKDGKESWYGPTLVLVGTEITTNGGYLLLLDPRPDASVEERGRRWTEALEEYQQDESIVILAHPDHPRLGWEQGNPAVDGIEVFDVFDQVVAAPWPRQFMGLLTYPANPEMAILSVVHWSRRVLERWDRMARERRTFGVLGLDAHGGIQLTEEAGVRFPSHETAFRLGQLHFVTDDPLARNDTDRLRVYRAMRAHRFYNAFDGLAPAAGFRFEARRDDAVALMGDSVRAGDGWVLQVRVPPVGETMVRIVRDGAVVHEAPGRDVVRVPVDAPGIYRVEVDLQASLFPIATARSMPWIFSNAIYATR
jgi:PHP domain